MKNICIYRGNLRYIESNSSGLFTELELYKGISQYDYDNNTDKLIEYLTHCKDWEEI